MSSVNWPMVCRWIITVGLGYVMAIPVSHNAVLLPTLALIGLASLALVILERKRPARATVIVVGLTIAVGVYGALIGLGNPGVSNGVLVWVVAPVLFGVWAVAGDERLVRMVLWAAATVTLALSVLALVYVGMAFLGFHVGGGILRSTLGMSFEWQKGGQPSIGMYGLSTLVATCPIFLTAMLLPAHRLLPPRLLTGAAGVLSFLASIVAGRAAITLVALAVPVVAWVAWRIVSRRQPRGRIQAIAPFAVAAAAVVAVAALTALGNSSVLKAIDRVGSIISGTGQTTDDHIRSVQIGELLNAWAKNPVFGHGLGAVIPGYERSVARPWNFELQYHLILFQTGLIGALLMLIALVVAVLALVKAFRVAPEMTPVLIVVSAGALAMLIANASNPYLQAPGNMWPVYFVLMLTNLILVPVSTRDREKVLTAV